MVLRQGVFQRWRSARQRKLVYRCSTFEDGIASNQKKIWEQKQPNQVLQSLQRLFSRPPIKVRVFVIEAFLKASRQLIQEVIFEEMQGIPTPPRMPSHRITAPPFGEVILILLNSISVQIALGEQVNLATSTPSFPLLLPVKFSKVISEMLTFEGNSSQAVLNVH